MLKAITQSNKRFIRRIAFKIFEWLGGERRLVLLGQIRADQIRMRGCLRDLSEAEFSVFSQWGEDGIISWLVDVIDPDNKTFVEFGVEDFREANCRYLMTTRNWSGLIIDGGRENLKTIRRDSISYKYDLQSTEAFITRENINKLIEGAGFASDIGLLSVDIDGVDYWVLENIDKRADIVIVEYNDLFSGFPVSVPYDPSFVRLDKHYSGTYWGASLDAFRYLLEGWGYVFIGTNSAGTNAFFVNGRHKSKLEGTLEAFTAWPCKMREARGSDGTAVLETYRESASKIKDLPLVDVTNDSKTTVGKSIR